MHNTPTLSSTLLVKDIEYETFIDAVIHNFVYAVMHTHWKKNATKRNYTFTSPDVTEIKHFQIKFRTVSPSVHVRELQVTCEPVSYTHLDVYKRQT